MGGPSSVSPFQPLSSFFLAGVPCHLEMPEGRPGAKEEVLWTSSWKNGFDGPMVASQRMAVFDFDCTLTAEHLFCG